jgi:hypothetical protein
MFDTFRLVVENPLIQMVFAAYIAKTIVLGPRFDVLMFITHGQRYIDCRALGIKFNEEKCAECEKVEEHILALRDGRFPYASDQSARKQIEYWERELTLLEDELFLKSS